jgi:SAM-dependent methyltransferase
MTDSARDHWNRRSAAWTATATRGKSGDDAFNRMLIDEAAIRPGERVLDLACGTGDPAISIALSMQGRGRLTACDLTPAMLAAARERAVSLELTAMDFVAADMCALPFAEGSFDCVTCRFGLMFPDDKVAAAREALRALRPGGRVAYMVWGPYDENPPFHVIRRTVAAFFGEDEGEPPHRHSMGTPGRIESVLDAAGFRRAGERELRYRRPVENLDSYITRGLQRGYPEKLAALDADGLARLKAALEQAFAPFREGAVVYMPNYARLGLGWRED